MPEPIQSTIAGVSLVTLAVAFFGPLVGPYIAIVFGASVGGLWPVASAVTATRMEGAWLMLRCVLTAVALTALIATLIGSIFKLPVTELYAAVAFLIAALGNRWQEIFDSIKTRVQGAISSAGGKP